MKFSIPHHLRRHKLTATLLASVLFAGPAMAGLEDAKAILEVLLKKGVITQKDYDQTLEEWSSKPLDSVPPVQFVQDALGVQAKEVQKAVEFTKKDEKNGSVQPSGVGWVSVDGENNINLTGMVHFDAHVINSGLPRTTDRDSASVADQFEFRRTRLGVNGSVYKDIGYELIINGTGSDTNIVDTGFINLSGNKDAQIRVGRFRQPYSLESMTRDASIDFMERSYGDQLGPQKQLGAMVWGEPVKGFTYAGALSQNGFNELTNSDNIGGLGTFRLTVNPAELKGLNGQVIHIGASSNIGKYEIVPTYSSNTGSAVDSVARATLLTLRTEDRGLANAYRVQLNGGTTAGTATYGSATNNAASVNKKLNDLEFAYAYDSFKYQTEYSKQQLSASVLTYAGTTNSINSLNVSTNYHEFVYNLTGEKWSDAYRGGSFTGIKPLSNFRLEKPGSVAWQLALRYSTYQADYIAANNSSSSSLAYRNENSESANTITYGVNWLLNPSAAIKVNYAVTSFGRAVKILSNSDSTTASNEKVISVRTQINF